MAQTTTSAPQQGVPMPAVDLRQFLGTLIATEGVRTPGDLVVSQRGAGANMSVDVAAGACVIKDDHASGGGFYAYTLGATANVAIGAANASNPRIDRVVVKILDNALGDASNSASVTVVAGTATSGATLTNLSGAAAVPSSSLLLANVLVPAAASSIVTADISNVPQLLGASNSMGLICSSTLAASAGSFDTNTILGGNLPQTYSHLKIVAMLRTDVAATTVTPVAMRFNGDGIASNYEYALLMGSNGAVADSFQATGSVGWAECAVASAATAVSAVYSMMEMTIPYYTNTFAYKQFQSVSTISGDNGNGNQSKRVYEGVFHQTAACTRVSIQPSAGGNFVTGSRFSVYGLP